MLKRFVLAMLTVVLLNACSAPVAVAASDAVVFASQVRLHAEHELLPPVIPTIDGKEHAKDFITLVKVCQKLGLRVVLTNIQELVEDLQPGQFLFGFYHHEGHTIYIDKAQPINSMFATLAHELGHHLQPRRLDGKPGAQVFAETFAYLVCKSVGLNTFTASATYLNLEFADELWVIQTYQPQIDAAVATVTPALKDAH